VLLVEFAAFDNEMVWQVLYWNVQLGTGAVNGRLLLLIGMVPARVWSEELVLVGYWSYR